MAAPNYEQIQSFNRVKSQLTEAAVDELLGEMYDGITVDEIISEATRIAVKYAYLGAELGAQWYELCSELAGIDIEPAMVGEVDAEALEAKAHAALNRPESTIGETAQQVFNSYLQNVINESIRTTGNANLWRDYERGLAGGRWARVPVGDTCAWCLMLASQGAWYLSEESALGREAGHYHDGCNCTAVYHADPDSIRGYENLGKYKAMYYEADNARIANNKGREKYPEELAQRIARAKAEHQLKYDAGETDKKWTVYNEDMIVMRYKYGLK